MIMKPIPLTRINLISSLTLLLALWLGGGWFAPAAYADDYFAGCGPAALRLNQLKEGIEAANANTGLDTLTLSPNCLYHFVAPLDLANESALPEITDDLLIRGRGATIQRDPDTNRRFRKDKIMPNLAPLKEYTFFLRGQPIFTANPSEPPIYLVVEGQVITSHKGEQIALIGPGEFLPGTLVSASPGLVALAGANCRLVAVDPVVFATLVDFPPAFVLQIL
jgi:hypothetical protein